ncbi:MAG: lactonase family protein [Bacteroidota bacterium]|nr:lactonase family protein [Bacteroidota bacterium]
MKRNIQLLVILFASVAFTFSSCKKDENNLSNSPASSGTLDISEKGMNPDETDLAPEAAARHNRGGYLYTESNATALNEILCYKQHGNGSLTLESTVASGGTGIGIFNGLGLDGQGALALSHNKKWLFAVNAGSNSISSFKVHNDGSLTLANTISSGGTVPVSLSIHHHHLYVVNSTSSNINGFQVGGGGTLTPIPGTNLPLSAAMTNPAQISFSPNGNYLYVTEKMTNMITSYEVNGSGVATFDVSYPSTGVTPFGFSFGRDNFMVVSNANAPGGMAVPNGSTATSYAGANPGNLNDVNGAVGNNQTAACWVATTNYGRFAYVTNTGSNTISTYYVSPWGSLYLIHSSASSTGAAPKDICVAANNYYVYALNTGAQTIGGYQRAFLGDLNAIGTTPGLPEFATGLVAW